MAGAYAELVVILAALAGLVLQGLIGVLAYYRGVANERARAEKEAKAAILEAKDDRSKIDASNAALSDADARDKLRHSSH